MQCKRGTRLVTHQTRLKEWTVWRGKTGAAADDAPPKRRGGSLLSSAFPGRAWERVEVGQSPWDESIDSHA